MLLANKTVVARLLPEQCSNYNAGLESNGGVTTPVSPVNDILDVVCLISIGLCRSLQCTGWLSDR